MKLHTDDLIYHQIVKKISTLVAPKPLTMVKIDAPENLSDHTLAFSLDIDFEGLKSFQTLPDYAISQLVYCYSNSVIDAWGSNQRIITYTKVSLLPELAKEPVLAESTWQWLKDSLNETDAALFFEAGTVSEIKNQPFGDLDDLETNLELEIRASWTPCTQGEDILNHFKGWFNFFNNVSGLKNH